MHNFFNAGKVVSFLFLFCLCLTTCFSTISFSQINEEQERLKREANFYQKPTTVVIPKSYSFEPYGIDATVISVGPFDNIRATNVPGFSETHIMANPMNPLNFVAADNRAIISSSNVYYTTDGGLNWTYSTTGSSSGDPVFAVDSLGNMYYTVLANGVRVYKSTNGGATWTNLGNAFSAPNTDKQWVACDQTGGPYSNNIYMAYSDFTTPVVIRFLKSTNGGTSWTTPAGIFGPGSAQGANITVGHTGNVYVCWRRTGGATLRISTNGGNSFGGDITIAQYSEPGTLHGSGRNVLKGDIRVNGFPQIEADISQSSPHKGNLYMTYPANDGGTDKANVYLVRSTNGGTAWNIFTPVKVNDDTTMNDQWMPDVSVDKKGRVWVFWYDSRNDPANLLTEVYAAVSTDGGNSFSHNFKVSNQPFNPNSVKVSQGGSPPHYYIGDYQSIASHDITLPFWMDGRAGGMHDYTAQLPDFGIEFGFDADTVGQSITLDNIVKAPTLGPYEGSVEYTASVSPTPSSGNINFTWSPSSTLSNFPDSLTLSTEIDAGVPNGSYTVTVTGLDTGNYNRTHKRSFTILVDTTVGVSLNLSEIPDRFELLQNYPNPFNPSTSIFYSIPTSGLVTLKVFDVLGREVTTLINEVKNPGNYKVDFNTTSNLSSGIYFYSIQSGDFREIKRMVLLK